MGEPKHTPGPWKVAPMTPTRVDTADGSISIMWGDNTDSRARERRAEANARLIVAAPEMLDALDMIVRAQRRGDVVFRDAALLDAACVAIRLAETGARS